MRILHILNVSNGSRLTADSGWVFADLIGGALISRGHDFTIAGPARIREAQSGFIQIDAPPNKYAARFGFDFAGLMKAINVAEPSHIIVNQPELVPEVRAALLESDRTAVIAAYCHYIPFYTGPVGLTDCPSLDDDRLGSAVRLGFLGGVSAADVALVHSKTALNWLESAADQHRVDLPRVNIIPPPRDPLFVAQRGDYDIEPRCQIPRSVLYNHRLYGHYGSEAFLEVAERLVASLGVRVLVTDVLGPRSPTRSRLDSSPDEFRERIALQPGLQLSDGGDRETYRGAFDGATIALAPFRLGCTWSMSCIDAQGLGIPVVAPRLAWYEEHMSEHLLYQNCDEAVEIVSRLISDPTFWQEMSDAAIRSTAHLEPHAIAGRLEAVLHP